MTWVVPCLWPGETFFILGGGPSLKGFDAEVLRGRGRVIACNEAGLAVEPDAPDLKPHAPWADVLYWGDKRWFNWNHKRLASHTGALKVARHAPGIETGLDIKVLPRCRDDLNEDGTALAGFCSGGASINLAYLLGARERGRIVLLGFDMQGDNWHERHQKGHDTSRYVTRFMPPIAAMAWPLKERGVTVLNCTPGSALTCFPFASLEEVMNHSVSPDLEDEGRPAPDRAMHTGLELVPARHLPAEIDRLAQFDALDVVVRLRGSDVVTPRSACWWQRKLARAFPQVVIVRADGDKAVISCRKARGEERSDRDA